MNTISLNSKKTSLATSHGKSNMFIKFVSSTIRAGKLKHLTSQTLDSNPTQAGLFWSMII